MRDQKIGKWFGANSIASVEGKQYGQVQTTALLPVVTAFDKNATQVAFMSDFPWQLAAFGKRIKMAEIGASINLFGAPLLGRHVYGVDDQTGEEISKRIRNEGVALVNLTRDILAGTVQSPVSLAGSISTDHLESFVGDDVRSAYDTLMSAQLVWAWTTFETLAGDLWETAVNVHPKTLAALAGLQKQTPKGEGKMIPMSFLERHGYNLRKRMGSVLRKHRCKFTKLDQIIKSYRMAFPERSALNARTFWDNQDVKTASAIRNLTVHKAGVVDREFLNKTRSDARVPPRVHGKQFYLDGELLQRLLKGLFGFAAQLIRSVDDWLIANPS